MLNIQDKQLHFIVGIGRSGTTLLTNILNTHPDIHCEPEVNFLLFFLNHYNKQKGYSLEDIDLIFEEIKIYSLSHPTVGWIFDFDDAKKNIKNICQSNKDLSYIDLCKHIYCQFKIEGKDKSNSKIILDKNPGYTIQLKHISQFSPQSKFIWLIRDYRANVLSRKQNAYLETPSVAFNALRWRYFNYMALRFQIKNPSKVLLIKYEDLVCNEKIIIEKICIFLNAKSTQILQGDLTTFKTKTTIPIFKDQEEYLTKKYTDLNKPINTSRVNSWKTELTKNEIILCETICGNFAEQFGYSRFQKKSFLKRIQNIAPHFILLSNSIYNFMKDRILYYESIQNKMKRLIAKHKSLNLIAK